MIEKGDAITSKGLTCPLCGNDKFTYYGRKSPNSPFLHGIICRNGKCERVIWQTREDFFDNFGIRIDPDPPKIKTAKDVKIPKTLKGAVLDAEIEEILEGT